MQEKYRTEDNTCITQNVLLTQANGNLGGKQDFLPVPSDTDAAVGVVAARLWVCGSPLWGSSAHAIDTMATFRLPRCETPVSV